jgi:hypothetical protein
MCTHISELGTEPTLIRSALKRGIRLCRLLLNLSDFCMSSYDLKFLLLKDRRHHTGFHAFYTNCSCLNRINPLAPMAVPMCATKMAVNGITLIFSHQIKELP